MQSTLLTTVFRFLRDQILCPPPRPNECYSTSERDFCLEPVPLENFLHNMEGVAPVLWGFPGGSDGRESACDAGYLGSIPGLGKSPGVGHGNPLQYSCLENPYGQRSLMGSAPWGDKDSDTTEHTHRHTPLL